MDTSLDPVESNEILVLLKSFPEKVKKYITAVLHPPNDNAIGPEKENYRTPPTKNEILLNSDISKEDYYRATFISVDDDWASSHTSTKFVFSQSLFRYRVEGMGSNYEYSNSIQ